MLILPGSSQSDVQISMGLVSDDMMTPSKRVTPQKAPQKQIRTPKKAEATEHGKNLIKSNFCENK